MTSSEMSLTLVSTPLFNRLTLKENVVARFVTTLKSSHISVFCTFQGGGLSSATTRDGVCVFLLFGELPVFSQYSHMCTLPPLPFLLFL